MHLVKPPGHRAAVELGILAGMDELILVPASELPADIRVETLDIDGRRYCLPKRGFAPPACALALFGLFVIAYVFWDVSFQPGGPLGGWGDVVVRLPLAGMGGLLVLIAGWLFASHDEVELVGGVLRGTTRCGVLRWRRSRPLALVRQLIVGGETMGDEDQLVVGDRPKTLSAILVECNGKRPMLIAVMYPRSLLRPLAIDLARHATEMKQKVVGSPGFQQAITVYEARKMAK
jgi:hypothetical protein